MTIIFLACLYFIEQKKGKKKILVYFHMDSVIVVLFFPTVVLWNILLLAMVDIHIAGSVILTGLAQLVHIEGKVIAK